METAALTFRRKQYSTSYSSHIFYGKRFCNDFFLNHNTIALVRNWLKLLSCVVIKGPFTRSVFKDPIFGSKKLEAGVQTVQFQGSLFCGENVGRSFEVCSHDPFFRTNNESSIWRQNDHAKIVGAFDLSRRVSDEKRSGMFYFHPFFQN